MAEEQHGFIVRDRNGGLVEYYEKNTVSFDATDGGIVTFTKGVAVENVPILLDFSAGDQSVRVDDGYLVKSAVIEKPVDLVAENIRRGKVIANIEGDFIGDTEEITVDGDNDLNFAGGDGDFVVEPSSEEKVISQVTISKPSELIPDNIAKGVTIAGVEGTHGGVNIAYGETEPADTSKLWIKGDEPTELLVSPESFGSVGGGVNTLSATLPTAAYGMGCAAVGNKIYLFGGQGSSVLNTINVFDTTTKTRQTLSVTLPVAMYRIGCAAVGSKIYLFGGYGGGYLNAIRVFDTTNNTISTLSVTLPTATYGVGCATVGNKIYIFGGGGNGYLNTINVFDTTNNTITTLSATLPTAAYRICCAVVGDNIYLFGGGGSADDLNTINVFDTTTNTIQKLSATLPKKTAGGGCAAVGNEIYVFGGASWSTYSNTICAFDTETNTIKTLSATLPDIAYEMGCAAVGDKIYLCGGSGAAKLNTINEFSLPISVTNGSVRVVTSGENNLFRLLPNLETYIYRVYRINDNSEVEQMDAFIYVDGEWTNIVPPSTNTWSVEAVNGATYGFALNGDYYVSQNKGKNLSAALCKVVITSTYGCTATFNCINSAEANFDFGMLSTLDKTLATSATVDSTNVYKSFKGLSMTTVQTVTYTIPAGSHFVYVKFYKDTSSNSGNDTLQFNVTLTD